MKPCCGCGKPTEDYLNYCNWDCHVQAVIREGGRVHTPNGLPVRCIKADGTLLEHEHGDHAGCAPDPRLLENALLLHGR